MKKILLIIGICVSIFTCDDPEVLEPSACEAIAVIDDTIFQDDTVLTCTIDAVELTGDCLEVTFGFSGCDDDKEIKLVSSSDIMESFPVQRNIKVVVIEPELCAAYFQKTISFDIVDLLPNGEGAVILNLENWDEQIRFEK